MSDGDVRANGPVTVRKGPEDAAVILVLDPAGEAPHDELPATWRPLAEQARVIWHRRPAARRAGRSVEELLPLEAAHRPVHVVGCADTVLTAVALAVEHRDRVASVVLVDPPWAGTDPDPDAARVERAAADLNVPVRQVYTGHTPNQRTAPPLPIGHPEVVRVVAALLVESELTT